MRQLLVECSDPGMVVSLAEDFENVLRQIDFDRVQSMRDQLRDLARELGPDHDKAWQGFRVEMPNDGGFPPSFGSREASDEGRLIELSAKAMERGIGKFEVRHTVLLPQDGPAPETREQYIQDLADSVRFASWQELGIFQSPVSLPLSMAEHRHRMMDDCVASLLKARAKYPTVGRHWVQDSVEQLRKALEDVSTRAEAVMEYELDRLRPEDLESPDRIRWAALACRLGKAVDKWTVAAEESFAYVYQRAAIIWHLWADRRHSGGPVQSFLEERLQALTGQAEGVYTKDALAALRLLYDEMHRRPWDKSDSPLIEKAQEDEDADPIKRSPEDCVSRDHPTLQ